MKFEFTPEDFEQWEKDAAGEFRCRTSAQKACDIANAKLAEFRKEYDELKNRFDASFRLNELERQETEKVRMVLTALKKEIEDAPKQWGYGSDGGFTPICVHILGERGKATHTVRLVRIEKLK